MYRYSPKSFNDLLHVMGCIRIGTLHNFRELEHKRGIADPMEGKKSVPHHIEHLHIADSSNKKSRSHPDMKALELFRAISIGDNCKNITFDNISLVQSFDVPDCFIFCTSREKSKKTMSQFEGADSCLQIHNIDAFYQLLTQTLNSITPVEFKGVHKVVYQNKNEKWNGDNWGHHPSLIKETRFSPQEELRAIWQPLINLKIAPQLLVNYKLGACCRYVQI
jgi:hypothetical protein